ncbi:hypothetical protein GE21DRAFT_1692 [Neurospora crassa]|uniref:Uncharacterized protein n=1 Tax=Neurospora crassa (strain ATCC 24698 / 74-OR23-1A / CBS 708.71 / DSM 1257 / FGSC 987) TaxID=367110 RepID=Q7SD35_NEUCR|nr:hypothetical protein NCU00989 [Neurospora crassa OR74A]EAA34663.1 hypothetical protein NCU00989 [Neurospora crassa OR74A]KHE79188.1 hypothetical protein GE21DRAFT_1692 [Neurospora crassa]|eukprot:XP_963899.1 hypothetical protein NCU00989 [Neurospora crassa OR74A]
MLVLRVDGGGGGGLEDIEAEAVWKSEILQICKKSIEDGGMARVKPVLVDVALMPSCPGFLIPTPQGGLWGYGPGNGGKAKAWKRESNPLYFKLCLVYNIYLEPESEQTKKGTIGTRQYIQLYNS